MTNEKPYTIDADGTVCHDEDVVSEETSADFLKRAGMNAEIWTDEFMKIMHGRIVGEDLDWGIVMAWFSNAIMAGYDHHRWKNEIDICGIKIKADSSLPPTDVWVAYPDGTRKQLIKNLGGCCE